MRERDLLQDLGVDYRIIPKRTLRKWEVRVWTGFIWLRISAIGELFWTWQ
jgi:hypothetical protein